MEVGPKITFPVISLESEVAAMIHLHLICGHISVFKRAQNCPNRLSHLREKDVSLMEVGLKITFLVISPEPKVATIIYLRLICGHILAFKRAHACSNQVNHLRETDVSSSGASLKITFLIISPEKEVADMIHLHLIYGHIVAY